MIQLYVLKLANFLETIILNKSLLTKLEIILQLVQNVIQHFFQFFVRMMNQDINEPQKSL